jgi:hypothetical protein
MLNQMGVRAPGPCAWRHQPERTRPLHRAVSRASPTMEAPQKQVQTLNNLPGASDVSLIRSGKGRRAPARTVDIAFGQQAWPAAT